MGAGEKVADNLVVRTGPSARPHEAIARAGFLEEAALMSSGRIDRDQVWRDTQDRDQPAWAREEDSGTKAPQEGKKDPEHQAA